MLKPLIADFTDYRAFAAAQFAYLCATQKYSHRAFSKRAGLGSHNYLLLVLKGERALGSVGAAKTAKGLQLDANETRAFLNLVYTVHRNEFEKPWDDAFTGKVA